MTNRMILIEMNEICPDLLRQWMDAGELPNFSRFYGESDVFITKPDVEEQKNLEPWIQWYSMHTGIDYARHGVFHLTDGPKAGHKDIWAMLREAGLKVGSFCSMNVGGFQSEGSFYVPDPWVTSERAFPNELGLFQDFVQSQVQEYTNPNQHFGPAEMIKVLTFLTTHGLSTQTVQRIVKQLAGEKLSDPRSSWKRSFILDWLCLDVFRHYLRKSQPDFATVFSNSVAHSQHAYWRYMEPDSFEAQPSEDEQKLYGNAILDSYRNSDALLGELIKLEKDGYSLVLASALSQQPFLKLEGIGGQRFYRMHDVAATLASLGITYEDVQPTMTHQYMMRFADQTARDAAKTKLDALRMDDQKVFEANPSEETSLYFGNPIRSVVEPGKMIEGFAGSNQPLPFDDHFYLIDETKSGYHHPDGVLWVKTGRHQVHDGRVSILDLVPTVLQWFAVPETKTRGYNLMGQSLLKSFART